MQKFELTDEQEKKFERWRKRLNKKLGGECYVGAVGGAYEFSFIPTGLGTLVKVRRATGEEIDLTDFNDW